MKTFGRILVYALFFAATWIANFFIVILFSVLFGTEAGEPISDLELLCILVVPIIASVAETIVFAQKWAIRRSRAQQPSDSAFSSNDELLQSAMDAILETGQASISMLQRRLNIDYSRASKIMKELEEKGYVGPLYGFQPRDILISKAQWRKLRTK